MNLGTLVVLITAIAFVLTLVIGALYSKKKSWVMTFLQSWAGVLFIFSGYVKAIDPLGTAYKMEQYFAEFQSTFSETMFSFMAPLFPWLSSFSLTFSILMIILEIVLGVMLLLGSRRKFTSWAFFILVLFFTFLTGFTYLTGYVPAGTNFFSFSSWGPYDELQMKVTDCGCFGDFLKLEPRVSFLKDLVLLLPALYFVLRYRDMHQLFTPAVRGWIIGGMVVILALYCVRNSVWALPHTDFRPFKEEVNIRTQKELEEQAEADRQIVSYTLKNKLTGKYVELPYEQYLKEFKSYPKTDWDVISQNMTEPAIPETKISEFIIYGPDDSDVTNEILSNPDYFLFFISHKLYYDDREEVRREYTDTVTVISDTIIEGVDTTYVYERTPETRVETVVDYDWDTEFIDRFEELVVPLAAEAKAAGLSSILVVGGADRDMINDFKTDTGIPFTICTADDILLKTIVRSNPGILLMKDGQILAKWHHNKFPGFEQLKSDYIK